MRLLISLALLIVLLTVVPMGCSKTSAPQSSQPSISQPEPAAQSEKGSAPAQTQQVSDIESVQLRFADGSVKKIADYKGKYVLLDFWATFCAPCIKKLPYIQQLQERFGDDKLSIIAVTLDPDMETATSWAQANDITLPIAQFTDEMQKIFFPEEETVVIPQARLISPEGKVIAQWGPQASVDEIEQRLTQLLGGE